MGTPQAPYPLRHVDEPALSDLLKDEAERAAKYAKSSRSDATLRAYASDWKIFGAYCEERGLTALPCGPAEVSVFVSHEAERGINPRTIERRVAAIGYYHRQAGEVPPVSAPGAGRLAEVMAGIRRKHGKPKERAEAAAARQLLNMLSTIEGTDLKAYRDRALLVLGMAAALRRSELVALEVSDIRLVPQGLEVVVRKSKTDQEGDGQVIPVPSGRHLRPRHTLLEWMDLAGHREGPLFRKIRAKQITDAAISDRYVARLVKRCASAAGYDPAQFSAHSLRAGFLTEAANNRASLFKMQDVSRHKTVQILTEYVRQAEKFDDHAGSGFL